MGRILRTAVIGLGARGLYLAKMYSDQQHSGFKLVAVCDSDSVRLGKVREQIGEGVCCYSDMHVMLGECDIDLVLVATNDPDHVDPAMSSLRAGRHVFVEKPLCQGVEDAQLIMTEARKAKGFLLMGLELREVTVFKTMKQFLDEGRIGQVKLAHVFDNVSVGGNYFFHSPHKQRSFYKSLVVQKACHSLDLLNWFMGSRPTKVYGVGGLDFYGGKEDPELRCRDCGRARECPYWIDGQGFQMDYGVTVEQDDFCVWSREMNLHDNAELVISYADGGKATFQECHFTPEYSREFWLTGTRGKMYGYYDNPGRHLIRIEYSHSDNQRTEEFRPPCNDGAHGGGDDNLREEVYRRIVENDEPSEALASAYYSTALAVCGEESIAKELPVVIPQLA